MWKCVCDCELGKIKVAQGRHLRNGSTKSCGCLTKHFARFTKEELLIKIQEFQDVHGRKPFTNEFAYILGVNSKVAEYNISKYELRPYLNNSFSSSYEREIANLFPTAMLGSRDIISPYELDIYIPEKKLAIEFNGNYWHSDIYKDKKYHQEKTIACAKKGIRLIHIFEYEWVNSKSKILNILNKQIISKDEAYIQETNEYDAADFLIKYHTQDYLESDIQIGCFIDNKITGIVTFKEELHKNKYRISQICWKDGIEIKNKIKEMVDYFINKYKPDSITAYCDISKFSGSTYIELGFIPAKENNITPPNYVWVDEHNKSVIRHQDIIDSKIINIIKDMDTEDSIMRNSKFLKIYDSGNLKLEWTKNQA